MSGRDPRARAMLRAYRESTGYDAAEREAQWERIESSLDRADAGPSLDRPAASPRWPVLGVAVVMAAAAALLLAWAPWRGRVRTEPRPSQAPRALVGEGPRVVDPLPSRAAEASAGPRPQPEPPQVADVAPKPEAASAAGARSATRPSLREGSRSGSTSVPAVDDPGASAGDELRAELVLIGKARHALQVGDPGRALEVLDAHARAFVQGQMHEDRLVLRIEALCKADKGQQARAEARQFLRAYPSSAHAGRVRDACPPP